MKNVKRDIRFTKYLGLILVIIITSWTTLSPMSRQNRVGHRSTYAAFMKYAVIVACLFRASAWAFLPTKDIGSRHFPVVRISINDIAGDAVSSYGGGPFEWDIDEAVASYAGSIEGMDVLSQKRQGSYGLEGDTTRSTTTRASTTAPKKTVGLREVSSDTTRSTTTRASTTDSKKIFGLPEVSTKSHSVIVDWKCGFQAAENDIGVVLVTQCSIDRLPNLQAQLACWTGKASVAVYKKTTESTLQATNAILSTLEQASTKIGNESSLDVAVTLVEGCTQGEAYPINYLRNVALLEAQGQHLRFSPSLNESAVLLVDVDFRPSANLHEMLHTQYARDFILNQGKAVVCPAFESTKDAQTSSVVSLKELVDNGEAEGFHVSYFPQGHGPTQFDRFWEISLRCTHYINEIEYFWSKIYTVRNHDLFEPYIAMASEDVPLYDERFQGYGLNKISHLASVAAAKGGEYLVLPGVFLVAPTHERSESWGKIYGNPQSKENKQNRMALKDLFNDFLMNLKKGLPPVVSDNTRAKHKALLEHSQDR